MARVVAGGAMSTRPLLIAALRTARTVTYVSGEANALGDFLRHRRDQLRPSDVGLPPTGRRRVPGLRREELAVLAGISPPYLARLERGRDRHPSARIVEQLSRALRLDDEARGHLHRLAGKEPAWPVSARAGRVRPGLRHLLATWDEQAAFVQDRFGTVLAANPLATALYPAFAPGVNLLHFVFLDPAARRLDPDWDIVVPRIVADVRATSAGAVGPDADAFAGLVDELTAASPAFARLWLRHDVREKSLGVKRFRHPELGLLALDFECLTVNGDPAQTLFVLFAEPGTPAARALDRLRAGLGR